jgi:hypothetical protein
MVKIAFWDNGLGERGTSVSLYDYAHFNETLLNNKSIIIYNNTHYSNNEAVIQKFTNRFKVFSVNNWSKVDNILLSEKCDIIYIIKAGEYDGQISNVCKNVIHCVFSCHQPHGHIYSSIAPWVIGNSGKYPVVRHMINLPNNDDNFRKELNIPDTAIVFGRHGGYKQFDIKFVQNTVYDIAEKNKNIYFLFMNTEPFCKSLENIIHFPVITDLSIKSKFINTCDAMLWGRSDGEIYSLSQGEFSIKNKPIITCTMGDIEHINILGDKAIIYESKIQLLNIFKNIKTIINSKSDWNAYRLYSPEKVMTLFKELIFDKCK